MGAPNEGRRGPLFLQDQGWPVESPDGGERPWIRSLAGALDEGALRLLVFVGSGKVQGGNWLKEP